MAVEEPLFSRMAQQMASKMAMERSYREEFTASNPVRALITHW
jgi:hypothetical protein